MPRNRTTAILYLLLVFASGILVGVVSNRLYITSTASANNSPRTMAEYRQKYFVEMKAKVGVSDEQTKAIAKILDQTKQKFDTLHAQEKPIHDKIQQDHIDEIKALLTEPQKIAYDNWRAERERTRAQARSSK